MFESLSIRPDRRSHLRDAVPVDGGIGSRTRFDLGLNARSAGFDGSVASMRRGMKYVPIHEFRPPERVRLAQ